MLMNKPVHDYTMPRPPPHQTHNPHLYQYPGNMGSKMRNHSKLGHNSHLNNYSVLGNNSTMNFYPHVLQPTRLSDVLGAGSSNGSTVRAPSTRTSLKHSAAQSLAKNVSFYKSGDVQMQPFKVAITRRNFRTFDSLLEALSDRIPLPFGVRTISTPNAIHRIHRLEEFEEGKSYVCSDKGTVKPLNLKATQHARPPWFISKPKTRTRAVAQLVRRPDDESLRSPLRLQQTKIPKKIFIVKNGEPTFRHSILLNRRTPQGFENILEDIGDIFRMRVQKLFTADGRKIESLQALYHGPNLYVAAGRENFQMMEYRVKKVVITDDKKDQADGENDLNKERTPKVVKKTQGRWRVNIATSELAAAGTDANVTITVYGVKGNTGPLLLNNGSRTTFRSGNEDEFAVSVGGIGEIRKVRIAHDNTGTSPGWLCESVTLTDVTTGQVLQFPCNRWLSRDEDDGEICREIAAQHTDKSPLPEFTYLVVVTTGNLWNAGTDASVYLTLFGDLGDSGPRLLQRGGKAEPQAKGRTFTYKINAVCLGALHRIVVGHDISDKGAGWFLKRIVVREDRVGSDEWTFVCDRWLDSGEDDGKIIRELYPEKEFRSYPRTRSQLDRHKDDQMWELEKWKFQRGNQLVLINHATRKALRLRHDAVVDGLGDPALPQCAFEVVLRRGNIRVFPNVSQSAFYLALDQNRVLGQGKGGSFSEFHVKVLPDRSVLLESVKYPGQHITVDPGGKPADTRGHANAPARLFTAYVKGCFRHESVILLNTSMTQALSVTSHGDVIGTGHRTDLGPVDVKRTTSNAENQYSHFRVMKVAEGVRMFQCERDKSRFLRIKDGQCDGWGNGDVYCHFKVHKYKQDGFITLQSMKHRGVFIGLNTNGKARPTVDTGEENTRFYPEIIKFGQRRTERAEVWQTPDNSFIASNYDDINPPSSRRELSPAKSKLSIATVTLRGRERSDTGPKDGDYRVYVTTGNSGTIETVTLFVYGDQGDSGGITLGKGMPGGSFQCGQTDEFQANLISVGEIKKIRIGMEEAAPDCDWRLKQVKMKDMMSNEILRFKFNRWISRQKDDGATVRELPVITPNGKPILPMFRYLVLVRTSKESTRLLPEKDSGELSPQHEVYLALHGENGDTGRRLLMRKPVKYSSESGEIPSPRPLFVPGQLDRFEIEAVSLGELKKCFLTCPKTNDTAAASQSWLCDEIIVRESEGAQVEYVFLCKKWLGTTRVGSTTQIKLDLASKRSVKRGPGESSEYKEGDWKVSITTGSAVKNGTTSKVIFEVCDITGASVGPIFLGSGADGLFETGQIERFKVNLLGLKDLYKVRLNIDGTGRDPSWYVERIKLHCVSSNVTHVLNVHKRLSFNEGPYQPFLEVPIPKPGEESPPVIRYQVMVYTGGLLGSDTDANVFIAIYGEKGDTGRRPLFKSLSHDVRFQESQVDLFEIDAVHLGDLSKIDIGHDGVGHGNGWFLHKVVIKEAEYSPKEYVFFCNKWLDDGQDDGKIERTINVERAFVREISLSSSPLYAAVKVMTPPSISPQVLDASISSDGKDEERTAPDKPQTKILPEPPEDLDPKATRSANASESKNSDVATSDRDYEQTFKNFYSLLASDPDEEDRFSLPNILRIDAVPFVTPTPSVTTMTHSPTISAQSLYDVVEAIDWPTPDQPTDRLIALDEEETYETKSEGKYDVIVTTSKESSGQTCPPDANVTMEIYGEEGKSSQIFLDHPAGDDLAERECFKPGQTDRFQIEVPEIGNIFKIRLSLNEKCNWPGWLVQSIVLEDVSSKKRIAFRCNRWLSATEDDQETIREFPISRDDRESLPIHQYFVTIVTGDRPGASTDANLFVTLCGERGDSGRRKLTHAHGESCPFQRNSSASFTLEAVDLGKLCEVVISHDGIGYGAGWFLERLTVKESEFATLEWVFPGHVWLDDHVGDCRTVRRLKLLGVSDSTAGEEELLSLTSPPSGDSTDLFMENMFDVTVLVDEVMTQGNESVTLKGVVYGDKGRHTSLSLGLWKPGQEKSFCDHVDLGDIGEITKLRVEMEDSPRDHNLLVLTVQLQNSRTKDLMMFNFHRKFTTESGSTVKELPAPKTNKPLQKVVSYLVNVDMVQDNDEVGCYGHLQLKLVGENGDSGFRTLFRGMDGLNCTKRVCGYLFELEAVDLGSLSTLALVYVNDDVVAEDGCWNIDSIHVKISHAPNTFAEKLAPDVICRSEVNQSFDAKSALLEVPLQRCEPEARIEEDFRVAAANKQVKLVKSSSAKSDGIWRLSFTTSPYDESSIFNSISATIHGTRSSSGIFNLSLAELDDVITTSDRQTRHIDCSLGSSIGDLHQLRLCLNEKTTVRVYKVKLKDLTTNQEYLSIISAAQRLSTRPDEKGALIYYLPLQKPDQDAVKQQKYTIKVKTGDCVSAGTDADIRFNLLGTKGDTGYRSLAELVSDGESLFGQGQVDTFVLETIDVGEPRKVMIGHTERGEGSGWFLDDITIRDTRDGLKTDHVFPCYKWFDNAVDDKVTQREICVMGTRVNQPNIDVTRSKGKWKCEIYAKADVINQEDLEMSFAVCLDDLTQHDIKRHLTKEVDEFHIQIPPAKSLSNDERVTSNMIKLRSLVDGAENFNRKIWPMKEFAMTDNDTGEMLRFVFDSAPVWEGSHRGYLRELPVSRFNEPIKPVVDYYIIFYTSDQSHRDFSPSLISCQLHGNHGDTGWRNIVTSENKQGKFLPGRVDVFTIEAVALDDAIDYVSLRVNGKVTQPWKLDRIKVKRGYYNNEEQIFECNRQIDQSQVYEFTQSKTASFYPLKPLYGSRNVDGRSARTQVQLDTEILWSGLDAFKQACAITSNKGTPVISVALQLTGDKGCTDLATVALNGAVAKSKGRHRSKLTMSVSKSEFGELRSVGLGILEPALSQTLPSHLKLFKISVRNQETKQYYSFRPQHSFIDGRNPINQKHITGSNWIDLAATRPRQDPSTVPKTCNYIINISTSAQQDAGTNSNVYITLVGSNGESGKRWLMTSSSGYDVSHREGEEVEVIVSSLYLGDLKQIIIGHDGREVTSGWYLEQVTVTSSLDAKKQFVFICGKWLANLQDDTFIERTLNLHHIIDVDKDATKT
ncbi:lipoxygenase homology domain-containing protein 1-like isoform X3 [Clavelina lepadiformis]|uniref:lipoxygenase homology domain-containing protein 1-like isoform X3 n=1 Tax=Clavelina lepadiformis TaxID=159417 RepID=UPI0040435595